MAQLFRRAGTAAVLLVMMGFGAAAQQPKTGGGSQPKPAAKPLAGTADAAALQEFRKRVDGYLELQRKYASKGPQLKESENPAEIKAAQEVLAETIQAARKTAKPGDIFTPEVRATFRRLMYPELSGPDGQETKAAIKEDAPTAVPLKVNAHYPESQPLSTVPPNLLMRLPQLPEQLEYRIVGQHLILRDAMANLIVDYMLNAIR